MNKHLLFIPFILSMSVTAPAQQYGTLKDARDGKVYKTVKIGNQVWMTENLNTNKFRNGDLIPEAKTSEEWENAIKLGQPAWCYYNNDSINGSKYGKLYNWFAVIDPRGLSPIGWRVPTQNDYRGLRYIKQYIFRYLAWRGIEEIFDKTGMKLLGYYILSLDRPVGTWGGPEKIEIAPGLKSTIGWNQISIDAVKITVDCGNCNYWVDRNTKDCSVCRNKRYLVKRIIPSQVKNGNGNNQSGFNAKPGGERNTSKKIFDAKGVYAGFWTTSAKVNRERNIISSYFGIKHEGEVEFSFDSYWNGLSVRCIKELLQDMKIAVDTTNNIIMDSIRRSTQFTSEEIEEIKRVTDEFWKQKSTDFQKISYSDCNESNFPWGIGCKNDFISYLNEIFNLKNKSNDLSSDLLFSLYMNKLLPEKSYRKKIITEFDYIKLKSIDFLNE